MKGVTLVAGAGGFIGGHLAKRLLAMGYTVRCVDLKPLDQWFQLHDKAENRVADLSEKACCLAAVEGVETVYNLACNMGGMGFIEHHKALCMLSVLINTHLLLAAKEHQVKKYFFASSACVYPDYLQDKTDGSALAESSVYPAMPEDGYGWEKLFGERMCRHFYEDFGLEVRVARFHNVYGPHGSWCDGREKAPAALCRKVLEAIKMGRDSIEVWGDGKQTRSFMYIDDCVEGVIRLMDSSCREPINIGRSELVTIDQLIETVCAIAGVSLHKVYDLSAPLGVRGRNSDNRKIRSILQWEPSTSLAQGMHSTFTWIKQQHRKGGCFA